jgi:hypothetical protein
MQFAHLLGCAIAHELGHMLLPRHSHSATGIMRATWDPGHLSIGTSDYVQFTPWQADWVRRSVAAVARERSQDASTCLAALLPGAPESSVSALSSECLVGTDPLGAPVFVESGGPDGSG